MKMHHIRSSPFYITPFALIVFIVSSVRTLFADGISSNLIEPRNYPCVFQYNPKFGGYYSYGLYCVGGGSPTNAATASGMQSGITPGHPEYWSPWSWITTPSPNPYAFDYACAGVSNNATISPNATIVYILGHTLNAGNQLVQFNIQTPSWLALAKPPFAETGYTIQCVGGILYVFGGVNPATGAISNAIWKYDPSFNQWSQFIPSQFPLLSRAYGDSVVIDGKIYLIGGCGYATGSSGGPLQNIATIECFDPATQILSQGGTMRTPRSHLACCAIDERIYAFGGTTRIDISNSGGAFPTNLVESVDAASVNPTWKLEPPMSSNRQGFRAITANYCVYLIGGNNGASILGTGELYLQSQPSAPALSMPNDSTSATLDDFESYPSTSALLATWSTASPGSALINSVNLKVDHTQYMEIDANLGGAPYYTCIRRVLKDLGGSAVNLSKFKTLMIDICGNPGYNDGIPAYSREGLVIQFVNAWGNQYWTSAAWVYDNRGVWSTQNVDISTCPFLSNVAEIRIFIFGYDYGHTRVAIDFPSSLASLVDQLAPSPPQGIPTVTVNSTSNVVVACPGSPINGTINIIGYNIYRNGVFLDSIPASASGTIASSGGIQAAPSYSSNFSVVYTDSTGVNPGENYTYEVAAVGSNGLTSTRTSPTTINIASGLPFTIATPVTATWKSLCQSIGVDPTAKVDPDSWYYRMYLGATKVIDANNAFLTYVAASTLVTSAALEAPNSYLAAKALASNAITTSPALPWLIGTYNVGNTSVIMPTLWSNIFAGVALNLLDTSSALDLNLGQEIVFDQTTGGLNLTPIERDKISGLLINTEALLASVIQNSPQAISDALNGLEALASYKTPTGIKSPSAPVGLTLLSSSNSQQYGFSWAPPASNTVDFYEIFRDGFFYDVIMTKYVGQTIANSYTDNWVASGSTHTYTVVALLGGQQSSQSLPITIPIPSSPPLPGGGGGGGGGGTTVVDTITLVNYSGPGGGLEALGANLGVATGQGITNFKLTVFEQTQNCTATVALYEANASGIGVGNQVAKVQVTKGNTMDASNSVNVSLKPYPTLYSWVLEQQDQNGNIIYDNGSKGILSY